MARHTLDPDCGRVGTCLDGDFAELVLLTLQLGCCRWIISKQIVHLVVVYFQARDTDMDPAVDGGDGGMEDVRQCPGDDAPLCIARPLAGDAERLSRSCGSICNHGGTVSL